MNAEVDNLKADLESAVAELEKTESQSMQPTADMPLASAGMEEALPPESAEAAPSNEQENPPEAPAGDAAPAERPARGRKPLSAPIGWTPELKQSFATLPEPVQKAIHAREVEVNRIFEETTASRRLAEHFVQTVQPYEALMKAEGAQHPLQAVQQLLNTAATLAMGSPVAKAQRIAGLIQHYGVDIETLDKALAGRMPEDPQEEKLQRLLDQKLQPYQNFMQHVEQMQQGQKQQVQVQAQQLIDQFGNDPKNEFYEDVRHTMADFMDVAVQNGQPMTLDEAYQRACAITPSVADEIMRRHSQNGVSQSKTNAASSISGRRSAGATGQTDYSKMNLRELLEAQVPGQQRV